MIDQIAMLLNRQADERIDVNSSAIAQELAEAPEGKMSVAISFTLTKTANRVFCASALSYSRKFKDEGEDSIEVPDPNQPELGEGSVTISSDTQSVTLPAGALGKLAKKLKGRKK